MPANQPIIHLIGGCNGAGKTTFAREYLPKEVHCLSFLNADEIARGLSPFDPVAVAVKAARTLLSEIQELIWKRVTFALESTLGGKTYAHLLSHAIEQGYRIHLQYLWLPSARIAIARVRQRVKKGGHGCSFSQYQAALPSQPQQPYSTLCTYCRLMGCLG
jgi:predicted ABC-type ATPase